MQLLLVEVVLAIAALWRGWRAAPAFLLAAGAAAFLWAPAGFASGIANGLALVALAALCAADPAEPLARPARRLAGRRKGALYQI